MRPPISSEKNTLKEEEFDGQKRSISYRGSILSFTRLQIKSNLVIPANFIGTVAVSILVSAIISPVNIRPLRAFPHWQSFSIIAFCAFILMLSLVTLTFLLQALSKKAVRGYEETVVLHKSGVCNNAKFFPTYITHLTQ